MILRVLTTHDSTTVIVNCTWLAFVASIQKGRKVLTVVRMAKNADTILTVLILKASGVHVAWGPSKSEFPWPLSSRDMAPGEKLSRAKRTKKYL